VGCLVKVNNVTNFIKIWSCRIIELKFNGVYIRQTTGKKSRSKR